MITKALILAAGKGSRLRKKFRNPKPTVRFFGLPLLERSIKILKKAGIKEFYVVVGYEKERVKKLIEKIRKKLKVEIKVIENPEWHKENGKSVLCAEGFIKEPFLLTMTDHIYEPKLIQEVLKFFKGKKIDKTYIIVDKKISDTHIDVDEATKVLFKDGELVDIGKKIKDFNGFDTGLFICNLDIFGALKEAEKGGDTTLSAGIRKLIKRGGVGVWSFEGYFWMDIDTPQDLRLARKILLKSLKKKEDGYISYLFNREISTRISSQLAKIRLSPNVISFFSFLLAVLGSVFFAFGKFILGGITVQLSSIIDGCDGEVARLNLDDSPYGAVFDTVLDRYADIIIVMGIFYFYFNLLPLWKILLFVFSSFGFVLASYSKKEWQLRFKKNLKEDFLLRLIKRDFRLFTIFIGGLLNKVFEFTLILGLFSHLVVIYKFIILQLFKKDSITH